MPSFNTSQALDVAIGLILLYLLLSLIVSGLSELIARFLSLRGKFLEKGLRNLLDDPEGTGLTKEILNHPLVRGMREDGAESIPREGSLPSYIPARTFTLALFDRIASGAGAAEGQADNLVAATSAGISSIRDDQLRSALGALQAQAGGDPDRFRAGVEDWYDAAMSRVSGWYKRRVQWILLGLGLALAIGLNADSFQVANSLYNNDVLRSAIVNEASQVSRTQPLSGNPKQRLQQAGRDVNQVTELKLPVGWSGAGGDPRHPPHDAGGWIAKVVGWLLTGLAISLGAPFWFDLLGRALSLRSSGPPAARANAAAAGSK